MATMLFIRLEPLLAEGSSLFYCIQFRHFIQKRWSK